MSLSTLPVHPVTGLRALGMTKRGPVWPVVGGSSEHTGGAGGAESGADGGDDPDGGDDGDDNAGDDQPLNAGGKKALDAERVANKALRKELAELKKSAATPKAKPAAKADVDDAGGDDPIAELTARLDQEIAARKAAESAASTAAVEALRLKLSTGKLPAAMAKLLTGTTEEEINEQIEELEPYVLTTAGGVPVPNPQQGQHSRKRATGAAAGTAEADKRFGKKTD